MAKLNTSFKFDTLVILDSLPVHEDPQTAVWLRDHILRPLTERHGFNLWYCRIENRVQMLAALGSIAAEVEAAGLSPVLHFESHGDEAGITLADQTLMPWTELKPWLAAINALSKMNLLAVMSMCHGWHLVSQLQPVEPSPVWALIGPIPTVLPSRLQEAFQVFYPTLMTTLDGRAAVDAMNAGRVGTSLEFKIETAEIMFCKVWRSYLKNACTPEALQSREDAAVAAMVRHARYDLRYAVMGRPMMRAELADRPRQFAQFRRSFLMLDLFPTNEGRFQLTFEDCENA